MTNIPRLYFGLLKYLDLSRIFNFLKVFISFGISAVFKKTVLWGDPISVTIEPANLCNFSCPECPVGSGELTRPPGEMKFEVFRRITDGLSPNTFYMQLFFQGEPFLNKEIFRMFSYAAEKRIYTSVSTNASLVKKNLNQLLEHPPDKIIFSIDGMDQESYASYRVGGSFTGAAEGMKLLAEKRNSRGQKKPFIEMQAIAMKQNENLLEGIKKNAYRLGADRCVVKTMQLRNIHSAEKYLPAAEKYRRYKIEGYELKLKSRLANRCFAIWKSSVITWDGRVVPCCFDKDAEFTITTLNGGDFSRVWKSAEYNSFRGRVLSGRKTIGMCNNCTEGVRISF